MSAARRTALRWVGYVAIAAAFAVACAFLSNWQFSRNAERAEQLELVAANYDDTPVPYAQVIPDGARLDPADEWRPVLLHGRYLADEQLLARNRAQGGTSAFEVLVPFQLDDGRIVVVDRGWVPPGADSPLPDEIPAPPSGEATVVVRLRPGEALPSSGRSAPDGQVPTINLPLIAQMLGTDAVDTSAYGLMVDEDPAPATRPEALPMPSEDPGPHLSYAIQWILFAIMGFVFIGYVIRTEIRHAREDGPRPPRARRPRDRDADAEDAILDADENDAPVASPADRHASATGLDTRV